VDTHGATQKAAVAGLQFIVDFVLHDHGRWIVRLGCVPVRFGLVELAGE
jgi:hypothetical protein